MTAYGGFFGLELRQGERDSGGKGSCAHCPAGPWAPPRQDARLVRRLYVCISYIHVVQRTFGSFSLPLFQTHTKVSKGSSHPCLQAAFQIPLSLSWSKACGYNTLRDGRRDQSRAPSPRALARAPLLPQKVGPRGLSLPGEGSVGPGRGRPLGGVETGPAWPRVYEARTQSKVPEEESESEVAGATAPVLSASVCPLNGPRGGGRHGGRRGRDGRTAHPDGHSLITPHQ